MTLTLFFTRGVSLKFWVDSGLFVREKLIYERLLEEGIFDSINWLTYGIKDDEIARELKQNNQLDERIYIHKMPGLFKIPKIGSTIFSFCLPFIHARILNQSTFFKTNQMDGSWSAVISKYLFRKPLYVRTGFTRSMFEAKQKSSCSLGVKIFRVVEKIAYRHCDVASVTSEHDRSYLHDKKIADKSKEILLIRNLIDIDKFYPQNIKRYQNKLLFVGRLNQQKNLFNLIDAVSQSSFILDIYGEGELEDDLKNFSKEKSASVNFYGRIPNEKLSNVYNAYQYYILPSKYEGMPKTLLEAMASGCVCIGTNVSGINEIIEDKVNGYLIETIAASDILKVLMSINESEHKYFVETGLQKITNNFAVNAIFKEEKSIYDSFK